MKDNKICFSKTVITLVGLVILIVGAFYVVNYINNQKLSRNSQAAGCQNFEKCAVQVPASSGKIQYFCPFQCAQANSAVYSKICKRYHNGTNWVSEWVTPPTGISCTRQPTSTPGPTAIVPTRWPTASGIGGQAAEDCTKYSGCWNLKERTGGGIIYGSGVCVKPNTCSILGYGFEGKYCRWVSANKAYEWVTPPTGISCTRQPTSTPGPTAIVPTRWPTLVPSDRLIKNCALQGKCYYPVKQLCVKVGQCANTDVVAGNDRGLWCNYDRASATPNWWNGYVINEPPTGINCGRVPTPTIP